MKLYVAIVIGLTFTLSAIWLPFYWIHVTGSGHWSNPPAVITAIGFAFIGLMFLLTAGEDKNSL